MSIYIGNPYEKMDSLEGPETPIDIWSIPNEKCNKIEWDSFFPFITWAK